jgi:hypothetical protein
MKSLNLFFTCTLTGCLLTLSQASAAVSIANPGFESGGITELGDNTYDEIDAKGTWFDRADSVNMGQGWEILVTGGNPDGYLDFTVDADAAQRMVIQGVTDNKTNTGLLDLTFDLNFTSDGTGTAPYLEAAVWGVENAGTATYSFTLNSTSVTNADVGDAVFLGGNSFSTTTGWEQQTVSDIDFGTGYDTIIIAFYSGHIADAGDFMGIDNVSIIPEPSSLVLMTFAVGAGLLMLRRRRA